jgi:hypothetical protein
MRRRKLMNASRLQQEVSRRLQRLQEVVDDGVRIGVPRPLPVPPDAGGCNWTMKHFGNAAGFEAAIADVLAQVRAEYNLDDDVEELAGPTSAATTPDDPFGGGGARQSGDANPFGETKPRERMNPFGDVGTTKTGDPFASPAAEDDGAKQASKRPADPFAAD